MSNSPVKIMKKILLFIAILLQFSCSQDKPDLEKLLAAGRWTDLTYTFDNNTVYWPTNIPFSHDTITYGINDKGYFYSSFRFSAEEHGGTHMDASIHFREGGRTIDQIPVSELTGFAVVIDVTRQAASDRDYQVMVDDCKEFEKVNGLIPEGSIVLLRTGWGIYYNDPAKFLGTLRKGTEGVNELHFPGLSAEAAEWLSGERKIKAVGIDTPSIDYGQSKDFMTHRVLCGRDVIAFENVAMLEKVPTMGAYIVAAPMKIGRGSGAPLRLLAWIPDK
jgi:kynurenine formamidase